jgi:very-short-patch-repair endonuclease
MAYFLDKRIVDYTRNHANEVNTLKWIISKKKKFPKWLFKNLKNAFPCILAWIRDYSDYIPLEKDLFDLIIIDEASQVSIAQSLPALIRWKKIIILWDDKQFSNVKSNNASKIVNQEYKTNIKKTFIEERLVWKEDEFGWLENVWNFDIKYSILKFSKSIQNYKCQLRKHFRWYPEIISYSNKFFYEWSLQYMKIRWKSIEDVIKIDIIPHDWLIDMAKNTNELEINYIIEKILKFKEKWIEQSLWIITPHQHQAWLLLDKINELPDKEWIFKTCKLKIMTFDSCQWEERDYIFYSMVATEEKDRLIYIFLKDFKTIDIEEDWSVKAQRMNVWFSRAKECMHFVLSKPINKFSWEIKNALLHYSNELDAGRKVNLWWTDVNSPMEKKIQEYFYETQFYKDNNNSIEFIPQFDIWKYLRQLDRIYNHPAYKVDFLLIYNNKKVVIEYDGFKEHFENIWSVDKYNYTSYMKADDIYRQKVLEWYGYKFLRINKFNIWDNPIETLDNRLSELFKKKK